MRHLPLMGLLASLSACTAEPAPSFPQLPAPPAELTPAPAPTAEAATPVGEAGRPPPVGVSGVVEALGTRSTVAGAAVVELDSAPPNATVSDDLGAFELVLTGRSPVQLWTPAAEGRLAASVAFNGGYADLVGGDVALVVPGQQEALALFQETTRVAWPEGVGVVVVEFEVPERRVAEGLSATLSAEHLAPFVWNEAGEPIPGNTLVAMPSRPWLMFAAVKPGEAKIEVRPNPKMGCEAPTRVTVRPRMWTRVLVRCFGEG